MTRKTFLQLGAAALVARAASLPAAVYPVPPLARKRDSRRSLDHVANEKILRFMLRGGIRHVVYGGNAFLYDVTLAEYRELIEWASGFSKEAEIIPAVGPAYGTAMDQAAIVKKYRFPSLLVLPNGNPRDVPGLEAGLREIAESAGIPLSLYVKNETNLGDDRDAACDMVGRLVDSKVCVSIKYAVVRKSPREDAYLTALLKRVDPAKVISGIGERPAVVHLRDFKLKGFTTGSGVLAPKQSRALLEACGREDYKKAEELRQLFMPLEDMRDAWGPQKVLHAAVALSGLADTGPIPPFVSGLSPEQIEKLRPVARTLLEKNG